MYTNSSTKVSIPMFSWSRNSISLFKKCIPKSITVEPLLIEPLNNREGNWMLHLASLQKMIPWCFAYDKLKYARFLSSPSWVASLFSLVAKIHFDKSQWIKQLKIQLIKTHRHQGEPNDSVSIQELSPGII